MKKISYTISVVILIIAVLPVFVYAQEQGVQPAKKVVEQCTKLARHSTETGKPKFIAQCAYYLGKSCSKNNECGAFPCVKGSCYIKPCKADSQCPNKMCGLNMTPVPGFCTTLDVK